MSHARTVGPTATILFVAGLIVAFGLAQPVSHGLPGNFRRSRKARRSLERPARAG
jgi:hypothetical protein